MIKTVKNIRDTIINMPEKNKSTPGLFLISVMLILFNNTDIKIMEKGISFSRILLKLVYLLGGGNKTKMEVEKYVKNKNEQITKIHEASKNINSAYLPFILSYLGIIITIITTIYISNDKKKTISTIISGIITNPKDDILLYYIIVVFIISIILYISHWIAFKSKAHIYFKAMGFAEYIILPFQSIRSIDKIDYKYVKNSINILKTLFTSMDDLSRYKSPEVNIEDEIQEYTKATKRLGNNYLYNYYYSILYVIPIIWNFIKNNPILIIISLGLFLYPFIKSLL